MRELWWWGLVFPAQLGISLLRQARCQREYWRSSLFHGARVCLSAAPLPDKAERLSRRGCADGIALWHDCCPAGFDLLRQACAHLGAEPQDRLWQHGLARCQRICQDGLVELGRAWSRC